MSKPKYSPEFKIMIAEAYLNGEGGFQYIANKYGVGVASVQLWVRCCQHHGRRGFMKRLGNASYFSDFKRECVEVVVIEGFSVNEVIAKYDIPNRIVLQRWIQVYNANRELKDYKPIRGIYMAGRKTSFEERREIAAAVCLILIDCGGEWGEIQFDFVSNMAEIVRRAEWDTMVGKMFAEQVAKYIRACDVNHLP